MTWWQWALVLWLPVAAVVGLFIGLGIRLADRVSSLPTTITYVHNHGMTTTHATLPADYLAAAVDSHTSATIAERATAAKLATKIARRESIDEVADEPLVLAEVYKTFTADELVAAQRSPVTRRYANVELARRAQ